MSVARARARARAGQGRAGRGCWNAWNACLAWPGLARNWIRSDSRWARVGIGLGLGWARAEEAGDSILDTCGARCNGTWGRGGDEAHHLVAHMGGSRSRLGHWLVSLTISSRLTRLHGVLLPNGWMLGAAGGSGGDGGGGSGGGRMLLNAGLGGGRAWPGLGSAETVWERKRASVLSHHPIKWYQGQLGEELLQQQQPTGVRGKQQRKQPLFCLGGEHTLP